MSVLSLVRLGVAVTLLALPFFGSPSNHASLLGSGPTTVSAQTSGQDPLLDIVDEDDDEAMTDEQSNDEQSVDQDSNSEQNGNGAEQEGGD